MKVWDMHCDTLAELRYAQQAGKPKSFLHNDLMMDLERMKQGDYLLQCMACFVHLEPEREKSPLLACLEEIDIFYRLLEQYPDDLMQVRTAADIQHDPCGEYDLPGGRRHEVLHTLHCMVLCGMDDQNFVVADPLDFNRVVPRVQFMKIYRQLGRRAVVIKKDS